MINSLMKISVIVPVYNEAKTLPLILKKLSRIPQIHQIVVVDDASTDGTAKSVKLLKNVRKLRHTTNMGKGAAVRTALSHIKHPLTFIQDADLEYDPRDISKLISKFKQQVTTSNSSTKSNYIAIYGSRLLGNPFPKQGYIRTLLGNHAITFFTNLLHGTRLTDSYTCYKLIPTRLLKSLNLVSSGFEIEAEITAKLARKGIRILEVPISYNPRSYSKGKKIKARDFIKAIATLTRIRFSSSR